MKKAVMAKDRVYLSAMRKRTSIDRKRALARTVEKLDILKHVQDTCNTERVIELLPPMFGNIILTLDDVHEISDACAKVRIKDGIIYFLFGEMVSGVAFPSDVQIKYVANMLTNNAKALIGVK